jgi:regulator of cell morphogenesis and NO signaling
VLGRVEGEVTTMQFGSETTVGTVAAEHPGTIRVFERYGIDFCCGGKRSLGDVCREKGVEVGALARELTAELALREEKVPTRWTDVELPAVVDHILRRFHRRLDEDLPRLAQMMQKVLGVYGAARPELAEAARTFAALREDIEPHMMKEERVLFPYIQRMHGLAGVGTPLLASPFGSIDSPIRVMEMEHESVGHLLAELRRLTNGYSAPPDACNTYRGLMHGLAELERDTHEHIHLENNVLFTRAKALEARLLMAHIAAASEARNG